MSSIASAALTPYMVFSEAPNQFAHNYCNDNPISALNYLWLTPLNIATNLVAMAITPLIAAVNLAVAGLFAAIGACCSDQQTQDAWYEAAADNAKAAIISCTVLEAVMLSRLFNVNACYGIFD